MATCSSNNLFIKKGDDKYFILTFKDNDQQVIDISTWVVFFTAKKNIGDTDEEAVIKKNVGPGEEEEHFDPTNGITKIHLTHVDTNINTGNYYYDIQIKKENGDIVTILTGLLIVTNEITRRDG